jgi:hypothetical protein
MNPVVKISDRAHAIVALDVQRQAELELLAQVDAEHDRVAAEFASRRAVCLTKLQAIDNAISAIWKGGQP